MEIILILILLASVLGNDDEAKERREKIKREHNARVAREKAKKKRAAAKRRANQHKRQMKGIERKLRKKFTGYATPKYKREQVRLHKEFNRRKKEYEQAIKESGEK
jgi:hypothetical protein